MIINLRGTNGSGKSTVAFELIARDKKAQKINLAYYETPKGAERHTQGIYLPKMDLVIVGKYDTSCGGCDGIPTQELIKTSVLSAWARAEHVLFEGVIVSSLLRLPARCFDRTHLIRHEVFLDRLPAVPCLDSS